MKRVTLPLSASLVLIAAAGAAIAIVASCTVFDGLDGKVIGGDASDAAGDVVDEQTLLAGEQAGYLSLADGVSFCANAFACPNLTTTTEFSVDVPVDANHFSSCVDWLSGPLPKDRHGHDETAAILKCAAAAKTCAAAGACMWADVIDKTDPRCVGRDAGKLGTCGDDGGAVFFCGNNAEIVHCENAYFAAGSTCMYDDAGAPWCTRLPCGTQQCLGDLDTYCGNDGLSYSVNCALGGFTCGLDTAEGFDDCLTNGTAKKCTALAVACTGTTVEICDSIYESDFDCSAYGGTCDQTTFPRCKRPNETCTPFDGDIDVCTGTSINLCVNGTKQAFDCASIGKVCADASGGQSGHCQ